MKTTLASLSFRITVIILISAFITSQKVDSQRLSRDLNVDLLTNQVGYIPSFGKNFVTKGKINSKFEITDLENQTIVFRGYFHPVPDDFGDYSSGDFSELSREGSRRQQASRQLLVP
jgi:hypothetical protein